MLRRTFLYTRQVLQVHVESEGKVVAHISFLGGFKLQIGDRVLTDELNRSMKLWNLLAYLIVHRNRSIPQAEFIEMLWPEDMDGNPLSALKTLFFRIRKMIASVLGEEQNLIVSRYSSYAWSREVECVVDAEDFEKCCRQASDAKLSDEDRIRFYRNVVDLYKGDFLPKLSSQLWTISFKTHYHSLYLAAVKEYADLLNNAGNYDEMAEVCLKAIQIDAYDERLHTLLLRALLAQGKHAAALNHYERATDFLYRNLGVHPSQELRSLYSQIMDVQKTLETDLAIIQESLSENYQKGAFICEFGFFKEAYRMACRLAARTGISVHVVLLTLSNKDGSIVDLNILSGAMNQLLEDSRLNLRQVDMITRYSGAQYLILLPRANYEDSIMVSERIRNAFGRHYRYRKLRLVCRIQPLDLTSITPKEPTDTTDFKYQAEDEPPLGDEQGVLL